MDIFTDDPEFPDIHVVQKVVNMFDGKPHMQRIITCGLFGMEYRDELDDTGEEDDFEHWAHGHSSFHGYGRLPGRSDGRGFHRNPSSSVYHPPLHYYTSAHEPSHPAVKVQAKENDTERKTRLLQESKKCKNKAEKKRLKKQKQKERKQREKLEKEKQNPAKNEEQKDDTQQSDAEENEAGKDEGDTNSSVKLSASAKDTDTSDSSENESSDEDRDAKNDSSNSEGLDMRSTFVSKAALIAMRKLEQKPRAEKKEKKKTSEKEERKSVPDDPNKGEEDGTKDSAAPSSATFEENVKISTNLANFGNKYASAGEFSMAVKYFTDAIKYNPTEFKLFGNRSFCFEKLQEYDKALTDAELSLGICPGWVKGLFRKGRALAGLKRYEEATQAFREVLKMDSSCAEAAQELMRVQITQLMDFGFTREQSSNALIIHGTVEKALEVLSKLNIQPGVTQNGAIQPAQVVNITGVSPVLSANTTPAAAAAAAAAAPSQDAPKQTHTNKPLGPVHNTSNVQSQSKPVYPRSMKTSDDGDQPPPELFPVWVGNLNYLVTESMIINLFTKAGVVYSAKVLVSKRCAFVNFTKQEYCDEAIRRFNGYELNGIKMVVRYPDRIPPGMGISKSALRAEDLQDENVRHSEYDDGRNAAGNRRFVRPYKHVQNYRGNY